jgi:uncharacterized protein
VKGFIFVLLFVVHGTTCWASLAEGKISFQKKEYATAFNELLPLAEQGETQAQLMLSYMYIEGLGVSINYIEAMNWLQKAAQQQDADAQLAIGLLYLNGLGVETDVKQAIDWMQKAAKQHNAMAEYNLGLIYRQNKEYQDYKKVVYWF